jgi:hypothetical protein
MRWILLFAASIFPAACLRTIDPEDLTRTTAAPAAAVACSACHPFPLQDPNHLEHGVSSPLFVKKVNGPVTCLDCHRGSILSVSEVIRDSIFRDSNGTLWSTQDDPAVPGLRAMSLLRVDTYVQHHPIPSPRAVPVAYGYQEWLTGMAHLNGRVDVEFDSAVSDTARFRGAKAEYDPKQQTCSAVSCHPRSGSYRFSACSKSLPEMRGGRNPLPSCDTTP